MQKIGNLIDEILLEWEQHVPKLPLLTLKIKTISDKNESFHTTFIQGKILLEANGYFAALQGISLLFVGAKSGYIHDFLGHSQMNYRLRPLWVGCHLEATVSSEMTLTLPDFLNLADKQADLDQQGKLFCRRVIELGYNAIIIGKREESKEGKENLKSADLLNKFCAILRAYELKVILKPTLTRATEKINRCPLNPDYQIGLAEKLEGFCKNISHFDYIFWESALLSSDFIKHSLADNHTFSELVTIDAKQIEKFLPKAIDLIYYVPSPNEKISKSHSQWLMNLCDDVGKKTIIAFSSVAGHFFDDEAPPHAFWETLRKTQYPSATRLLPIINIGQLEQGEGLWPTPTLDLIENYCMNLKRHHFAGFICLVNKLPIKGGMLDCSMWIASHSLWHTLSSRQLLSTWLSAFRPNWKVEKSSVILLEARKLALNLNYLRSLTQESKRDGISTEECRVRTESILARLKDLQLQAEILERSVTKKGAFPSLVDYLRFFSVDAQRIVMRFLQCFNLSSPYGNTDDHQDSFWFQVAPGKGQGIRSSMHIAFNEEPRQGNAGSRMEAIYQENRRF